MGDAVIRYREKNKVVPREMSSFGIIVVFFFEGSDSMKFFINFILVFLFLYILYYFLFVRKARKNKKKIPVEVQYLILKYQIDLSKVKYKKFMNSIALVESFDIALIASAIFYVHGLLLQLFVGLCLVFPVIILSFMLLGKYYQKVTKEAGVIDEEMEEPKKDKVTKERKKVEKGERKK